MPLSFPHPPPSRYSNGYGVVVGGEMLIPETDFRETGLAERTSGAGARDGGESGA